LFSLSQQRLTTFCCPEKQQTGVYSEASDVWAWAVTVFEVLTQGSTPYGTKQGAMDIARSIIRDGLRLEYPDIVGQSVRDMLDSCMAEDPADRPSFRDIVTFMDSQADTGEVIYADLKTFGTLESHADGENLEDLRASVNSQYAKY
jgi:fibroblast growth factor receptor 1